ncbi:hypothetical protein GWI33_021273 [Rhynchophorus ferrugineus]|uniref:CHK kinase-like domain-containing protein n=1 Tax=Rhynchophorus ferrugineus TaxID=354439 RepID=A0A834HMZ6_RHYFE|nr:hypothetical protein GWI33_021273 [Rhynchophorus ferrugineus]
MACGRAETNIMAMLKSNTIFRVHELTRMLEEHYRHSITILDKAVKVVQKPEDEIHMTRHIRYRLRIRHAPNRKTEYLTFYCKISPIYLLRITPIITLNLLMRFRKEIYAYKVMIPNMDKFQKERSQITLRDTDLFSNIFPKCYGARLTLQVSDAPDSGSALVLDDLPQRGYVNMDFRNGIDLETMKSMLRLLARYHGTTLAFKYVLPYKFDEVIDPCLKWFNFAPDSYVCVPSEVDYLRKHILKTSFKTRIDVVDRLMQFSLNNMTQPTTDAWVSVCHGKFMLYNVMRREFDVPKFVEFKIIDLQHQVRRHVLTDVILFLMTSCPPNFTREQCDIALYWYYEELFNNLRRYNGVILTEFKKHEFKYEVRDTFKREFVRGLQMLRFVCCKKIHEDKVRSLSTWPRYDLREIESCIDYNLYYRRLQEVLVNIFDHDIFDL